MHKSTWTLKSGLRMSVSVTQHLRSSIVANAFFSNLKTHKSQIFPMAAPRGVAKISTSTKVTIFLPLVTYYFISDQYLKGDLWTTLFLRNSIWQWICNVFEPIKREIFWEEKLTKYKSSSQHTFGFIQIQLYQTFATTKSCKF